MFVVQSEVCVFALGCNEPAKYHILELPCILYCDKSFCVRGYTNSKK